MTLKRGIVVAGVVAGAALSVACGSNSGGGGGGGGGSSGGGGGGSTGTQGGSAGFTITIQNMAYSPAQLVVPPGAVITVVNMDGSMPHSVTSESSNNAFTPGSVGGVQFDTGAFTGQRTFTVPTNAPNGTVIPYYCSVHLGGMATPNGSIKIDTSATAGGTTGTSGGTGGTTGTSGGGTSAPPSPPMGGGGGGGGGSTGTQGGSASFTITIHNLAYSPAQLAVPPGAVVTVVNQDGSMPHSVTSESSNNAFTPGSVGGVKFDTGVFTGQRTFTIPTNVANGTVIPYYCAVHLGRMATPNGSIKIDTSATAGGTGGTTGTSSGGTSAPPSPPMGGDDGGQDGDGDK